MAVVVLVVGVQGAAEIVNIKVAVESHPAALVVLKVYVPELL